MLALPVELLTKIGFYLNISEVDTLNQTCHRFHETFTDDFWKHRFIKEYNSKPIHSKTWKQFYKEVGQIWYNDSMSFTKSNLLLGKMQGDFRPIQICAGLEHCLFLDESKNTYTWEWNSWDDNPRRMPQFKAKQISAGAFLAAIDTHDKIWGWGLDDEYNEATCLNLVAKYINVGTLDSVSYIDFNNNLWAWDSVDAEQNQEIKAKSTVSYDSKSLIIDIDNLLWTCDWTQDEPMVNTKHYAKQIAIGSDMELFVDLDDWLWYREYNDEQFIKSKMQVLSIAISVSSILAVDLLHQLWIYVDASDDWPDCTYNVFEHLADFKPYQWILVPDFWALQVSSSHHIILIQGADMGHSRF